MELPSGSGPLSDLSHFKDQNQGTGSHPSIRFEQIPITPGPLFHLDQIRPQILNDVVKKTKEELLHSPLEVLLGEALYSEKLRLKRMPSPIFIRARTKADKALWSSIQNGLVKPAAEVDRAVLLDQVVRHYAEEIGGHFNEKVYQFATRAVPWGFSWLLNAASVKRFLPWGMTQSLGSRLHILGEVPALQRLAKKGTILLAPTHQSNIDSLVIGYIIYLMSLPPFAYGAGLNLFSNPILSFFMSQLGSYTVDRHKSNAIYKHTLKNYSARILREGIHCIFFPGGGRSRTGAIETKLKLGLLGTGLEAQIEATQFKTTQANSSRVFIVPMVMSYHFVLEANSLIEDYLAEAGKHRFIQSEDESWQPMKILGFFWKLFSSKSGITVRIGKPLDIFGNFVDEEGQSIGPNGTTIDPQRWLTTRGELRCEPQRDAEYTRELGRRLTDRFHKENTVLTSHLVAFSFFETLRKKYMDFDLFRFLRLSLAQRSMPYQDFLSAAEIYQKRLQDQAARGDLFLCEEIAASATENWVKDGVRQLGLLHDAAVVKVQDGVIWTEDMSLLYYYRNRLAGYGLSALFKSENDRAFHHLGANDSQGFLA
jgi:glycerol-3-phosphate O-acyltransferase